jgi:hypothetical protein
MTSQNGGTMPQSNAGEKLAAQPNSDETSRARQSPDEHLVVLLVLVSVSYIISHPRPVGTFSFEVG